MKDRPERQQLEEALKDEPAGSAKIQALADYSKLKEIEYKLEHRQAGADEFDFQLDIQKIILEQAIQQKHYRKDAAAYCEAFDSAGVILAPYFEKYNGNTGQVLLDDLREINRGKSRK